MIGSSLKRYISLAREGTMASIGEIMSRLRPDISVVESKFIDFALSNVEGEKGVNIMEHYLFHGTQIQRNYCALYFGRLGEYPLLRRAYEEGRIDATQAFSR